MENFDDIRPYQNSEVSGVIDRLLKNDEFFSAIARLQLPRLNKFSPWLAKILLVKSLKRKLREIKTIGAVQKEMSNYVEKILKTFINGRFTFFMDNKKAETPIFLISIGICRYSGSGMQLTDYKHHKNGYFDVTLIKSIKLLKVILNILKLYNGNIERLKEVESYRVQELKTIGNTSSYIQADGELIGIGDVHISVIPQAIQFIVN